MRKIQSGNETTPLLGGWGRGEGPGDEANVHFKNNHVIPPFRSRSLLRTGGWKPKMAFIFPVRSWIVRSSRFWVPRRTRYGAIRHSSFHLAVSHQSIRIPELINLRNARQLAPFTVGGFCQGMAVEIPYRLFTVHVQICKYRKCVILRIYGEIHGDFERSRNRLYDNASAHAPYHTPCVLTLLRRAYWMWSSKTKDCGCKKSYSSSDFKHQGTSTYNYNVHSVNCEQDWK